MKSKKSFVGLISFISLVALANTSLNILVDGLPFNADFDKLKVGAKVKVECTSADINSFVSASVSGDGSNRASSGSTVDGYVKGTAAAEYTVKENDGTNIGKIFVRCNASRNGKISDEQKSVLLNTVREPDRNRNPAKLNSMNVRIEQPKTDVLPKSEVKRVQ